MPWGHIRAFIVLKIPPVSPQSWGCQDVTFPGFCAALSILCLKREQQTPLPQGLSNELGKAMRSCWLEETTWASPETCKSTMAMHRFFISEDDFGLQQQHVVKDLKRPTTITACVDAVLGECLRDGHCLCLHLMCVFFSSNRSLVSTACISFHILQEPLRGDKSCFSGAEAQLGFSSSATITLLIITAQLTSV